MDRIQVRVLDDYGNDAAQVMRFLARMTQRGHTIHSIDDAIELYEKKGSDKLTKNLAELNHGTIKRFANYTVVIYGASRRFLAQIRTHQHAEFVSGSLQYSDFSKEQNPKDMFVVPYELLDNSSLSQYYLDCCVRTFEQYCAIASAVGNDPAGFVLPNGMRNILVIRANIQEWQYIISLRTCRRNSLETRYVLYRIWEELYKTPDGELIFGPASTGAGCQKGKCLEGHMTCSNPLPKDTTPSELLKMEFPLLCKEA